MERPVFRVGEGAISVDGFVIPAVWCGGEAGGGEEEEGEMQRRTLDGMNSPPSD